MNLCQHYNDLTEINGLRYGGHGRYEGYGQEAKKVLPLAEALAEAEKKIKTRIAFTDVKTSYPATIKMMDAAGWKIARKTLDWHDSHGGDSELRLYYKIFPENKSDVDDKQTRKSSTYNCHHSLNGSCSMGLWDKLDADWIVNMQARYQPERYLTLIRLDRKRTKEEIAKMRYYRYRLVFRSDVARYFANGWEPDAWMGKEKEKAFWNTPEAPKKLGFVYQAKAK